MPQVFKVKNSNVEGKVPAADDLAVAELALSLKDQKLYSKDADDNVFEIGKCIEYGATPPANGKPGDLWIDTNECPPTLNVWDDCGDPGNPSWTPIGGGGADPIVFTVSIDDDGTADGNKVGKTLTASAQNIAGGTAPEVKAYQWKSGGVDVGTESAYVLQSTDIGLTITCDVTVAEPDDSDPVTLTGTYVKSVVSALAVAKGVITPASDVETGDTVTGSATVTGAVNPVETHVFSLDGSEVQRGTSATYVTTAAGSVRYRKEVTDDYATVIGEWSDPVVVVAPAGPTATMHGLRFDSERKTYLSRTPEAEGNRRVWTYSAWVKRGKLGTEQQLWRANLNNPQNTTDLLFRSDNKIRIYTVIDNTTIANKVTSQVFQDVGVWMHLVVSFDSPTTKIYIDGDEVTSFSVDTSPSSAYDSWINTTNPHLIGRNILTEEIYGDFYLSDVYFVDGQELPPETFGKSFEGKWGPLDSSKVKDNIQTVQAPVAPNYDEKWSDDASASVSIGTVSSVTNAFDGDLSTRLVSDTNGSTLTLTLNPALPVENKLRVYVGNFNDVTVDGVTESAGEDPNGNYWISFEGQRSVDSIIVSNRDENTRGTIWAIEADGRVLIDGPANNSQVWSDEFNGFYYNLYGDAFNGSTTSGYTIAGDQTDTPGELTWDVPVEFQSKELVLIMVADNNNPTACSFLTNLLAEQKINNGGTDLGVSPDNANLNLYELTLASGTTSITVKTISSSSRAAGFAAIKAEGKVLIDDVAKWNTSKVWSNSATSNPVFSNSSASNGFNGNTSNAFLSDAQTGGYAEVANLNLTSVTSLEIWTDMGRGAGTSGTELGVSLNGGTAIPLDTVATGWITVPNPPSAIDTLRVTATGNDYAGWNALRVNGEILVDAGSFGENGFFLPFDPAATGEIYSSGADITTTGNANWTSVFDGNLDNGTSETVTDIKTGSWTIADALPGQLQLWFNNGKNLNGTSWLEVNGNPVIVSADGPNQSKWVTIPGITSLESLNITSSNSDDWGSISGIRVGDKVLVDYNNIGVDASGQDNHFHDENFAVGNTSQVWSNNTSNVGGFNPGLGITNLFDGNTSTAASGFGPAATNTFTVTFSPALNVASNLKLYFDQANRAYAINQTTGNGNTPPTAAALATGSGWNDVGFTGNLASIHFFGNTTSDLAPWCSAIEVDGKILIDVNMQDTVLDTPMKNYAVLTTGSNGNLVANEIDSSTVASTYEFTSGKKYAEFSFTKGSGGAGGGEICFTADASYEIISDGRIYINGSLTNTGPTWEENDIVGIALDADTHSFDVYVNGTLSQNISFATDPPTAYNLYSANVSAINTNNFGQQPYAYPQAGYEGLYQTWEQWARTALGYTQDQLAEATKKLAAQEPYVQLMRALIREWQPGNAYNYGDIVQLNGMTYQAEANDIRLIAPDAVTAGGNILWRPLVRVAPARKLERPETEQPTVLPAPEPEEPGIDFVPGVTGGSISTMTIEEESPRKRARNEDGTYRGDDPSTPDVNEAWEGGEEPPAKGKRKGKKKS